MKIQNIDIKKDVNALNLLNEMVIRMAKVVNENTNECVDGTQIFKKDYTSSNENSKFEIEFSEKLDEKLNFLTKEIAKYRYAQDLDLALTSENGNALDVNEVNENNFFNASDENAKNEEALNMINQDWFESNNINTLDKSTFKKHSQRYGIESFELELSSDLNRKLKHIIDHFVEYEKIKPLEIAENVMIFGITRCHIMSYWQAKTYLFMQSEVFRNIDIFSDTIRHVDEKLADCSGSTIKYKDIFIKNDYADDYETINISKYFETDAEINGFNIALTGHLKNVFKELSEIWFQKYDMNSAKCLEYAIQVGINSVYDMPHDEYEFADLLRDVCMYDQF